MKSAAIGLTAATGLAALASSAIAQEKKPNIIVIMGDDVGWENIGAYHQGLMYDTTPNLDKLAGEGMRFTDYYAEPSCTAGRANFITGELPIRTGLTTVGQAGAKVGMPDVCGGVMAKLKADGLDDNTIVVFTTDNGAENFTWPDGGNTPFAAGKGTIMEGGMRVPMIARWPGHIPAGKVENGIFSGLDFFPTFAAIAGDANIKQELLTGKQLGDKTFKVHLDGYDQTNVLTGKGPSNRHEIFYFAEGTLGAVRLDDWKFRMIDQPNGWLAGTVKLDWPTCPISGSILSSGCSSRRATKARSNT
jgi:arylsulfatase A-like enzyme